MKKNLMYRLIALAFCIFILLLSGLTAFSKNIYVSTAKGASDKNPGTRALPVQSVAKGLSLAAPGDSVIFSAGKYDCSEAKSADGIDGKRITLCSAGNGKVTFSGDGTHNLVVPGSFTTVYGIEFSMTGDHPKGSGIYISRKGNLDVLNCRFFACNVGVKAISSDPADECAWIEVRNCWMHDAGWNIEGTEGYGITANGAVENLVIENCQIDNNTGDGILYEDWAVHTTARYNVIRGTGIAAIWIDNASMSVFDNNFLYGNNVGVWLSGEESSNRYLSDMISIRNNIIVHNDWAAIDTSVYGRIIVLFSQNVRDVYFDNNTVAYNNCTRVVGFQKRPPLTTFRNIWFRNNIFWQNTGAVGIDPGLDTSVIRFRNNLWSAVYPADSKAIKGDPAFENPDAAAPEGYRLKKGSAAIDAGMLLYDNPLDFWNGARPHLKSSGVYDVGAIESGTSGSAHIGLDLKTFPFEVTPFKLQFKAKPKR